MKPAKLLCTALLAISALIFSGCERNNHSDLPNDAKPITKADWDKIDITSGIWKLSPAYTILPNGEKEIWEGSGLSLYCFKKDNTAESYHWTDFNYNYAAIVTWSAELEKGKIVLGPDTYYVTDYKEDLIQMKGAKASIDLERLSVEEEDHWKTEMEKLLPFKEL
ncbi:MAG: hypothetical protein IJ202_02315 [Bacteroidales bacterium]|nr:hypothetical protein [Bacteroidales bacterium]